MQNISNLPRLLNNEFEIIELEAWDQDNISAKGICAYKFDVEGTIIELSVQMKIAHSPGIVTQRAKVKIEPFNQSIFDVVTRFFNPMEGDNTLVAHRKRPFELLINDIKI